MKTLVEAIEGKYGDLEEDTLNDSTCVIYVPKSNIKTSKSGSLTLPERLTMEDCSISSMGDSIKLKEMCQTVKELDLSKNSLQDWKEVISILQNIPTLYFLNLSRNAFSNETCPEDTFSFPCLSNLVLNGTGVSWNVVAQLVSWFPSLKELHLSLMDYTSIGLPETLNHSSLKKLYLNECNICEWKEISKLGHAFTNLEYLNLLNINIKRLGDADQFDNFPSLRSLNISGTELESWAEIDKFRYFPSLTHVRVTELSILRAWDPKERRQHIIARLPNITMLNGSPISDTERQDAERAFVRYYMDREEKNERFHELEEVYGKLDPLVQLDLSPQRIIKVTVRLDEKIELFDVDSYMTALDLKKMLRRFAGCPASKFNLYIRRIAHGHLMMTEKIVPLTKQVYRLNLNPEDIIEIVSKEFALFT